MGDEEQNTARDERVEQIRERIERGEEPSPEEKDFLRSAGIELPPGEGTAPPAV